MNSLKLAIINWKTTLPGALFVLALYLHSNPDALSGLVDPALAKQIAGWASLLTGFVTFATSKASNVSGNGTVSNPAKVANADGGNTIMAPMVAALLIPALACQGCAQFTSFQNNPGVRAAETAAIGIGVTLAGQPELAALAPIAVNGLTYVANKGNPAVTGNVAVDVPLIVSAVSAMIPNSKGKTAAVQIAQAYKQGMTATGSTTPAAANAVLAVVASGLNTGITSTLGGSNSKIHKNESIANYASKMLAPTYAQIHFRNDPQRAFWIRGDDAPIGPVPFQIIASK
jgi:hypothetical protein